MTKEFKGGIYAITVKGVGVYYGESANIKARWATHRRKLYSGRHHCVRLRRAFKELGIGAFTFTILQQSELLEKSQVARVAVEQALINADSNCLNTKGNESTVIKNNQLPIKSQYKNKIVHLKKFGKGNWVSIRNSAGDLLGTEPLEGTMRLGKFKSDSKCMLSRVA